MTYYSVFCLSIILFDQISKFFILSHIESLPYDFNQFVTVTYVVNRGLMSGIFHSHQQWIFVALTMMIIVFTLCLLGYSVDRYLRGYLIIAETFILSGAISNIIDRILRGGVIDFIELHAGNFTWPIFNIADMCIVCGAALLLWHSIRGDECLA